MNFGVSDTGSGVWLATKWRFAMYNRKRVRITGPTGSRFKMTLDKIILCRGFGPFCFRVFAESWSQSGLCNRLQANMAWRVAHSLQRLQGRAKRLPGPSARVWPQYGYFGR